MDFLSAIILGFIEGLSEFLPVSSTGHMILGAKLLGLEQNDTLKCFEVVIQLGSILAVVAMFFRRLERDFSLLVKLALGFVPTGLIGLLLYKHINALFVPNTVAYALIIGGVVFIVVELFRMRREKAANSAEDKSEQISTELSDKDEIARISYKQAFIIGLAQCLAMVPGTSRSGATIVAGLLCGLSRQGAAAFSFLLAVPTMLAATVYDSYKNRAIFIENSENIWIFLLGGAVAFVVALVVLRLFLSFVSRFSYISFGVYRIIAGAVFLLFVL